MCATSRIVCCCLLGACIASGFGVEIPSLSIQVSSNPNGVTLRWPGAATDFFLEETLSLIPPVTWNRVNTAPTLQGAEFVLNLDATPALKYFRLRTGTNSDLDGDGIPDDVEVALGFNPTLRDTDGDGIPDGDEDLDGDGLKTSFEIKNGLNPLARDTDGNGIPDNLEDPDNDGLTNLAEQTNGTNPGKVDSDGDGFDDNGEILDGSDPNNPASSPLEIVTSTKVSFLNALPDPAPAGTTIQVATASATYLNALPDPAPVDTPQSILAQSTVSYLNALPDPAPAETVQTLASLPVTYVNAVAETIPTDTSISIVAPLTSYLNAATSVFSGDVFLFSALVSYSNE